MLELTGVTHQYGSLTALDDVTLSVTDGKVGLVGVNGAGKTTLLSVASGAVMPTSGLVAVNGSSPYDRPQRREALARIALMPQYLEVPSHLTAHEAVSYLTWMRGARWRDAVRAAHSALADVGLAQRANSKLRALSGGMARRVALAQAIALKPAVLLLDEPTTGLDPEQRRSVLDLVANLDATVVMSSHIIEDIATVCDTVVVLHDGRIKFHGTLAELQALAAEPSSPRALEDAFVSLIAAEKSE